jgi:hypothetical protein
VLCRWGKKLASNAPGPPPQPSLPAVRRAMIVMLYPALNEVIRLIARRGGFLGRKGDGEPGARTLWLGLQEIAIFVEGARYAREFSEAGTYV